MIKSHLPCGCNANYIHLPPYSVFVDYDIRQCQLCLKKFLHRTVFCISFLNDFEKDIEWNTIFIIEVD